MGVLKYFCAGASSWEVIPGGSVENILFPTPSVMKSSSSLSQHQQLLEQVAPQQVIIDSGGFQLLLAEGDGVEVTHNPKKNLIWTKNKLNLAPEHVVGLASSLARTPDIMIGLDYPVGKISEPDAQENEFYNKLIYNSSWARQMCLLKQAANLNDTKLYIPIQCYNLRQLDTFFSKIEGCQYDGVSMPVRNMTATQLILFLATFYKRGIREIHLLGATSLSNIMIAAFFANHFFDWISIDSQTWRIFGEHSTYLSPYDLSSHSIGYDVKIEGDIVSPCACPWCNGRTFPKMKNEDYGDKFWLLSRHNFWVTDDIVKRAYNHADTPQSLEKFLRSITTAEKFQKLSTTIRGLEIFELMAGKPVIDLEQAMSILS